MGLCRKIINLRWTDFRNQSHQVAGIGDIRKMQEKLNFVIIRPENVVNPRGIADTVPADQSMDLVSLL